MEGSHVKAQNESRLEIYDTVIKGSEDFGVLSEFGADVLLFGSTKVAQCNIGLLAHKIERDSEDRAVVKQSTIRVLSNAVVVADCVECDESCSGGGLIIRFVGILQELLDVVETTAEVTDLFERMESALAMWPEGHATAPTQWNCADFVKRATDMSLRLGSQVWSRSLAQHFGRVIRHVKSLLRPVEDMVYINESELPGSC